MSNLWRECQVIAAKAGIDKKVTCHIFRHSFISINLQNGGNIKAISEYVGHSKPNVTIGVYAHANFDDKKKVQENFAKLVKVK
jgi:integrase